MDAPRLIKYMSPSLRCVFVDSQLYTELPDQDRLSLILLTSRLLLQDWNTLPKCIYVADAETGDLLGVEGEIY